MPQRADLGLDAAGLASPGSELEMQGPRAQPMPIESKSVCKRAPQVVLKVPGSVPAEDPPLHGNENPWGAFP